MAADNEGKAKWSAKIKDIGGHLVNEKGCSMNGFYLSVQEADWGTLVHEQLLTIEHFFFRQYLITKGYQTRRWNQTR